MQKPLVLLVEEVEAKIKSELQNEMVVKVADPATGAHTDCPKCGGRGYIVLSEGAFLNHKSTLSMPCPVCNGEAA